MELDQVELLISISGVLEKHNIPYMLTGAWSVIYFGRPRASHDIDFIVEIDEKQMERILAALHSLSTEYDFQEASVRHAVQSKDMFNVIFLPTFLKLDFWILKNDKFDIERFARRIKIKISGQKVMIATAEDTILQKLRWYKISPIEKHLVDAAFVYQIQKKNLNEKYLKKWANELNVSKLLEELKRLDLEKFI